MINRVSFFVLSLVLSLTISLAHAQIPEIDLDSLRQEAEQGDVEAQYKLGYAYYDGKGVPQDYAESLKWFRKAAEQWNAKAQYSLGNSYYNGKGGPKDYVKAHMWYNLAASKSEGQTRKDAVTMRDIIAEKILDHDEVSEAQRLAREWAEEHRP